MKYGIVCAMEEEIRLLASDMVAQKTETVAKRNFFCGTLYGKEVVLVKSMIGKVASASTATTLIDRFKVDCVVFCGTAGGIDKALNVGDVVIADKLIQHDFDQGVPEYLFVIPGHNIAYFETDKKLSERIAKAVFEYTDKTFREDIPKEHLDEFGIISPKSVVGTIASGDQFICDAEKNKWLEDKIDNLKCVEMEGASVAQICREFEVPLAVVRVISDSANDDSNVDFMKFITDAACHFTRGIIKAFLEKE